ncbi:MULTISPECIES: LysE/ArgO family amino acid transporter [unclassified Crossiella]|uniref:LysE/ArgO family amino acid transporter n=1 Tax=unclassified Crossiella TaxID=2620835 RepID=UPI001FFED690|nr:MULTISPECIES: LysE family transporter [unclassified Crossiella]MCK2241549.1 LysE family transporter [Crossiella sp. S99.2]MCK2255579.1 LysE family transporter [Crossiella sp. S99.1]
MIEALVAGLLAGYGIAMPVGAVATYLVALSARTSLRIGAAAALGVAAADGLYALLAVLGGAALTDLLRPVAEPLRWASVLILVGLAIRTAYSAVRRFRDGQDPASTESPPKPGRAFLLLLGITVLNPTTVVYFSALVLGRSGAAATGWSAIVFVLAAFLASASWQLVLATGGSLLGRVLTGPRGRLATALASATLITGLAISLVLG